MAQENLIKGFRNSVYDRSGNPIPRIYWRHSRIQHSRPTVHLPRASWQPIAADDVASALAEVALDAPVNGMIEIAGPDRAGLDKLVGRFLNVTKDPRQVVTDVNARYYGLVVNDQSLTPGANPRIGATSFEGWLQII
jgi:uncharacterized protein YbjT (DUF2867 family)